MGKDGRYDFDAGSTDSIGGDSETSGDTQSVQDEKAETRQESEPESASQSEEDSPTEPESHQNPADTDTTMSTNDSLPQGGEAGPLRTGATNHTLPEEFSMANLPVKQRRSNVKEYRDIDLTIAIQQKTMDDVRDAKRKLEDHFGEGVPKTDVYEIVMIAGANDDLSLLDAANIVGYGIN